MLVSALGTIGETLASFHSRDIPAPKSLKSARLALHHI